MRKGLTQRVKNMGFSKGIDMVSVASVERFQGAPKAIIPQRFWRVVNQSSPSGGAS